MKSIPEILKEIANISSTKEKENILRQHSNNHNLKTIMVYAYHKHINFGITKVDESQIVYNNSPSLDDYYFKLFKLLDKLKNRELTGNAAREATVAQINLATKDYGDMILNILNKDLRIGAGIKIINKVWKDLLPTDFCQLADKFNLKKAKFPCYVDIKLDGVRAIGLTSGIFSRSEKEFKNYENIEREKNLILEYFEVNEYGLDGEITLGKHFQEIMRTVSKKDGGIDASKEAIYNIFDIQIANMKLKNRLGVLSAIDEFITENNLKYVKVVKGKIVNNYEELLTYYRECVEAGWEGIMIKDLDAKYEFKRSNNWTKMKPEETADVMIVGFEEGTGKNEGKLGAFICKTNKGVETEIGIGFKDAEREEYWNKKNLLINTIIEVKYQEETLEGCLRFGKYVRLRPDKVSL